MGIQQKPNKKTTLLGSIRARLILVTGIILLLAAIITVISYLSLRSIQQTIQTSLKEANQIRELSLGVQNEFLQARQNEASLLYTWRTTGYGVEESVYVISNGNHIAQARKLLDDMENLVKRSNDPNIVSIGDETNNLRPFLDAYETAFQVTVKDIRERVQSGGQEEQLQSELGQLEESVKNVPNPAFLESILLIRANTAAYFSSGKKAYADQVTNGLETFMTNLWSSKPEDLKGTTLTTPQMIVHAQNYLRVFNAMATKEVNSKFNREIFSKVNEKINQSIARITSISDTGLTRAQSRLDNINKQAVITLLLTASLALITGILAAIFLTSSIIPPLNQLIIATQRMGGGQLDLRVNIKGGTELSVLGDSFNSMADQLQKILGELELRVAERTRDLVRRTSQIQVAAEIAREAASVRELDTLLNQAVNLVKDRFGFYHAGIFLIDALGEYAVLQAATGEAGRSMLEHHHRLKVGEVGIVGNVCNTGKPRISLDVGKDTTYLRNPLLPDTHSEIALPLKIGLRIIGALDVQSQEMGAFHDEDIAVLQTMADQLAIAIDNARLYKEAQDNLQQLQTIYSRYGQESWKNQLQVRKVIGYQYESTGVKPIYENRTGKRDEGLEKSPSPYNGKPSSSIPLKVRGQTIGLLEVWAEQSTWTSMDENMLNELSDHLSQAMESARLFEETRAHATSEQMLSQLTARFARSIGLNTLLQTAVQELGQLPNISEVSIHIGLPETENNIENFGNPQMTQEST